MRRGRAIAFGKTALVDNSAALIRTARRQTRLGGRYADVVRDRAVIAFGVPAKLRDKNIDDYLDKLRGRARFSDLAAAADQASDRASLVAAAQALWHYTLIRDRTREGCFVAFSQNHWLGATVFAGIALSLALR